MDFAPGMVIKIERAAEDKPGPPPGSPVPSKPIVPVPPKQGLSTASLVLIVIAVLALVSGGKR